MLSPENEALLLSMTEVVRRQIERGLEMLELRRYFEDHPWSSRGVTDRLLPWGETYLFPLVTDVELEWDGQKRVN